MPCTLEWPGIHRVPALAADGATSRKPCKSSHIAQRSPGRGFRQRAGSHLAVTGAAMHDTTRALADSPHLAPDLPPGVAILAGALLGGLGGFLFFTTRGGQVRHDLERQAASLLGGLDAALAGWASLQRHATALRSGDTRDQAATPARS